MNAIVGACRPWLNQNVNDYCGPYLVDLTDANNFTIGASVQNLPTNASCTYRAISTCGYPEAYFRVHNASYRSDFDVAWATDDGMTPDEDLEGFNRAWTPAWNGSETAKANVEYYYLGQASRTDVNAARIADDLWNSCKGVSRNLWITVTRVKDSSKSAERTARSLVGAAPYNPGARFPDFELSFASKQGGQPTPTGAASMVATLAVALISALAVLAF